MIRAVKLINTKPNEMKKKQLAQRQNSSKTLCNETSYPHDSALTKRFVVKITVERCDEFLVAVPQIFDRVKSVALWSAKKKRKTKDHKPIHLCIKKHAYLSKAEVNE
jgi:hypothetical protein